MKSLQRMILSAGMAALLAQPLASRADVDTNAMPDFKEVRDLIAAHLAGETESKLNHDTVLGLLNQLHGRVSLVSAKGATAGSTNEMALAKSGMYDGPIGYVRIGRVQDGLAKKISAACKELSHTNQLEGLVVDLRFASGDDYGEAAAVADLFVAKEHPLVDWGKGVVQSKEKTNALTLPVMVLVNAKTSGAAEALAAMLRESDRAILLGVNTAGEAAISQEFTLKSGETLRIATSPVKIGDGESLSAKGVAPDIHVTVKPDDELAYLADPFKEMQTAASLAAGDSGSNGTNRVHTHLLTEVDLMRARKEKPGVDLDNLPASSLEPRDHDTTPEKPVIHDPVLGRALDLIKGIAVMRRAQP